VGPSPLCGSPVWVGPLCGSPVWVPCVSPLCVGPLCGSPWWVPRRATSRCVPCGIYLRDVFRSFTRSRSWYALARHRRSGQRGELRRQSGYLLPLLGHLLLKVGRFGLGVRVVLVLATSSFFWKSLVVLLAALLCSSRPGAEAMMMVGRSARRGDGQGGAGARRCALPVRVWPTVARCGLRVWRQDHRESIVGRPEGAQPPNTAGGNTIRGEHSTRGNPTRQQYHWSHGEPGGRRAGPRPHLGCSVACGIYSIGGCYTCYIVYYTIVLHSVLDANFGI